MGAFNGSLRRITVLSLITLCLVSGTGYWPPLIGVPVQAASTDLPVYGDALATNWQNWSWNSNVNFSQATPTHSGSAAIGVSYTAGWAGLSLRAPSPLDASLYQAISFWVHGGSSGTRALTFFSQQSDSGGNSPQVNIDAPAGVWTQFTINLSALGNPGAIARLNWQERTGSPQPAFAVDDIVLVAAPPDAGVSGTIRVNTVGAATAIDPRLLGSNLPAWLNPTNLANTTFRARTVASGVTVLRMPGGSWSNAYGWLSCELGANQPNALACGSGWESWAAKPTDFINFIKATGKSSLWVVSPNGTPQEAAAAVAFFNASTTDSTVIGMDSNGFNWQTAGHWAQLRAAHGNPDPLNIKLWSFGNEIYGGTKASGGAQCQDWGWETVWSCDGTEYVNGLGNHAGYTAFRSAMRAVDPTIQVGAVGIYPSTDYNNWGNEVVAAAGATMDYYDIHQYAYFNPPASYAAVLAQPQTGWRSLMTDVRAAFNTHAGGRAIPVGVTEYNLFSAQDQDNNQWLTRAVNALFLADTIGQLIQQSFVMGNQWDLANGPAGNGTDYGLLQINNNWRRSPQYYVFPLWSRFGGTLLPSETTFNAATQLSVYAGSIDSSTFSVLAINKTSAPITATLTLSGSNGLLNVTGGTVDVVKADTLSDQTVTYNNVSDPADDLSNAPAAALSQTGSAIVHTFAPHSITLLRLQTGSTPATATPTATSTATATPTPPATPTSTATPTPTQTPISDLIFADDFETGNLAGWSASVIDGGDLSVSPTAALVGGQGLRALVDDNAAIYVTDDRPAAEARYRARFYFDPNTLPMVSGNAHYLFYGYSGLSTEVLRIELRFAGGYQLRAALRNDSSTWTSSKWFVISDTPHYIEIDWQAATGAGANNGGLTFWIDGTQRAILSGSDNDTRRIDHIRLGAVAGIDSGTRGSYFFDAFTSHRQSYSGPASGQGGQPTPPTTAVTEVQTTPTILATAQLQPGLKQSLTGMVDGIEVRLDCPANAVTEPTTVTLTALDNQTQPATFRLLGQMIAIQAASASGTTLPRFATPVSITFRFAAAQAQADLAQAVTLQEWQEGPAVWQVLGMTGDGAMGQLTAPLAQPGLVAIFVAEENEGQWLYLPAIQR